MHGLIPQPQRRQFVGKNLVRLTYFDEGGTSRAEPYAVVAGPIVHGDRQLAAAEAALDALIEKHIPALDREGFTFHATDIWSGVRNFRNRDVWPMPRRVAILEDLADIPVKLGLPIAYGGANKERTRRMLEPDIPSARVLDFVYHAAAYATATQLVERYFRSRFDNEYTIIIAEDRPKVRRLIKAAHASLQDRGPYRLPEEVLSRFVELPYHHIRDTIHFAEKAESKCLQIADICAFLFRGYLAGQTGTRAIFNRIGPALLTFDDLLLEPRP